MDPQESTLNDQAAKFLVWTNLFLLAISNFIIYKTWYNVIFAETDTMFMGFFLIVLFSVSVYYLVLLSWGVRLQKHINNPEKKIILQSIILLMLNIAPIISIYLVMT